MNWREGAYRRQVRKRLNQGLKSSQGPRERDFGPQVPSTGDDQIDGEGSDGPEHQRSERCSAKCPRGPESVNDHKFRLGRRDTFHH